MFGCAHFFNTSLRLLGLLNSLRSAKPAKVSNSDFFKFLSQQQDTLKSEGYTLHWKSWAPSEWVTKRPLTLSSLVRALHSLSLLVVGFSLLDAAGWARLAGPRAPATGISFRRGLTSRLGRRIWGGALARKKKKEKEKLTQGKSVSTLH